MKLTSLANESEHWTKRSKRNKNQSNSVYFCLLQKRSEISKIKFPCEIILTRIAPRKFDDDNLIISFKHIRDQIAQMFFPDTKKGKADGYECFSWKYEQLKGKPKEYLIKVRIQEAEYCRLQN